MHTKKQNPPHHKHACPHKFRQSFFSSIRLSSVLPAFPFTVITTEQHRDVASTLKSTNLFFINFLLKISAQRTSHKKSQCPCSKTEVISKSGFDKSRGRTSFPFILTYIVYTEQVNFSSDFDNFCNFPKITLQSFCLSSMILYTKRKNIYY